MKQEEFDFETTIGIDKMKKAVRLYDKTFAEAVKSKKTELIPGGGEEGKKGGKPLTEENDGGTMR